MSKMERNGVAKEGTTVNPSSGSLKLDSRSPGSPVIVLLGVVALAAMALGLVIGFLIGLMV